MGNICGNQDIYKQIASQHPEELKKYIVGEQIKNALTNTVSDLQNKVGSQANNIKEGNLNQIESKKTELIHQFNDYKDQIDKTNPLGGVKGLEKTNNTSLQKMTGFDKITQNFDNIKSNYLQKFNQEEKTVNNQLQNLKQTKLQEIAKNQPDVSFMSTLTDKLKNDILAQGLKQNQIAVGQQTQGYFHKLGDAINPETYLSKFNGLFNKGVFDNLVKSSKLDLQNKALPFMGKQPITKHLLY